MSSLHPPLQRSEVYKKVHSGVSWSIYENIEEELLCHRRAVESSWLEDPGLEVGDEMDNLMMAIRIDLEDRGILL